MMNHLLETIRGWIDRCRLIVNPKNCQASQSVGQTIYDQKASSRYIGIYIIKWINHFF